jgi:hypothetical protein
VSETSQTSPTQPPTPRAFTQGVGTIFQWLGVPLFLLMMFVCCSSSLLSKDTATKSDLRTIGWHLRTDVADHPTYSAQFATTLTVTLGVFFGMALASIGLGLQAQNPRTPIFAILLTAIATSFWIVQTIFFATILHSILLTAGCAILALLFAACLMLAVGAARQMWRDPPPRGIERLPEDYKVPYSHLHQDPPDVRLAAELEQRRNRLEVQQKELEALEERIKRRMKQTGE